MVSADAKPNCGGWRATCWAQATRRYGAQHELERNRQWADPGGKQKACLYAPPERDRGVGQPRTRAALSFHDRAVVCADQFSRHSTLGIERSCILPAACKEPLVLVAKRRL